jgi:TolB-like protein
VDAGALISELKRRRVIRALVGYGIAAFAVLQIIEPVMHGLHWSEEVLSYVVVALAVGFPIVMSLAWIFDVKAGRIERTPAGALRGSRAALLLVLLGALAAAPGLLWYFGWHKAQARPAPGPSIAVLPLVNLSSDKEQEYFSDGLSEELLNLLAKVPGLRVAARTSTFAFKGKNEDVSEIGQRLHVATILEGSVRKAGDRIRITTQLINAADGYHLWSETYDRKLTDVFVVQDEIAQAVVDSLKLKLLTVPSSKERRTANTDAYNQYLLGRQFFHRNNIDGFRRARQAFDKAVELDPQYAPAWAGLALATFWVADSSETLEKVIAGQDRAVEAADRAIALAPDLADGYLARGFVRVPIKWDFLGSKADFDRALQLKPDDPDVLYNYAVGVLRPLRRFPEAIAAARRATELDPLNPRPWFALGASLFSSGQGEAARDAFNRSLEISPDQSFAAFALGITWLTEGKPEEAKKIFPRSTNIVFRLAGAALAQHDLHHPTESQRALDELITKESHDGAYQIAEVYAWRGETDRAFEWLERAMKQRDGGLILANVDQLLKGLRSDPRYPALLKKMNLPPE